MKLFFGVNTEVERECERECERKQSSGDWQECISLSERVVLEPFFSSECLLPIIFIMFLCAHTDGMCCDLPWVRLFF